VISDFRRLCYKQGKLVEAEAMMRKALNGYDKILPPEHNFTLNTVHSLGFGYEKLGKHLEAESLLQRALRFVRRL